MTCGAGEVGRTASTAAGDHGARTVRPVILAAGAGTRFSGSTHKLRAVLRGRPVVRWALEHADAARLGPLLVVTGAVELDPSWLPADAEVVHNDRWADGQASSLRTALDHAGAVDAVVVGLGDQPFITPEAWRAVAACPSPVAVATYDGQRANPVKLSREVWDLVSGEGDQGARPLMRLRPELVTEVPCPGDAADIDDLEDLDRWNS